MPIIPFLKNLMFYTPELSRIQGILHKVQFVIWQNKHDYLVSSYKPTLLMNNLLQTVPTPQKPLSRLDRCDPENERFKEPIICSILTAKMLDIVEYTCRNILP